MPRYAQLVMGPAGAGKSTYVNTVEQHYATLRRKVHCINLDPAAEHFVYPVQCDIRELISVDDVMEDNELRSVLFSFLLLVFSAVVLFVLLIFCSSFCPVVLQTLL